MKRAITLGIGALALATLSFPAAAADLGARPIGRAPVMAPVPIYNWSGFYIGGHVGGLWGDKDWADFTVPPITADGGHDISGFLAGGQVGFNWQAGAWVFGIEAQASWTNADGSHSSGALGGTCFPGGLIAGGTTCSTEMNWLGSVAGRVGYAFNNVLLYAKGGFAFANEDYVIFDTATGGLGLLATTATDETRTGWMVGAGLEYGFTPNWSFKIEYNYMDFGTDNFVMFDPILDVTLNKEIHQQIHVVKAGINYRFNWGAPIVARY